ncbi:MAG: ATP-binding cassette domain-containing protein, partial [Clostridiaceae bacterium]|nr:ATP-binding cassette domain-containing protein [Clostridiaceae bacterium]
MINDNKIRNINCNKCNSGLCCTKIQDFGVTIGNTVILKDINLHIHCGDLTALIGANGAGKSTLIKALLGGIPHSG